MALDTNINSKKILWIVVLNVLVLLIPAVGGILIRSGDYKALNLRRIATEELSRTIISHDRYIPVFSPYQRVIIVNNESLETVLDTGWQTSYSINAYSYNFPLAQFLNHSLGEIPEPELEKSEIIERLSPYIGKDTPKTSIIDYRYIYTTRPLDRNQTTIVLSDKSDLVRNAAIYKIMLYSISLVSIFTAILISFIYYKTGKSIIKSSVELEEFTDDVLHELKNPLTTIRNSTENLPSTEAGELILKETGRIEKLLFDIKKYAVINNSKQGAEGCNPAEIIDNLMVLYKVYEIKTTITCFDSIRLNEDQFISVITNIVDNAVSFSPDPGTVEIKYLKGAILEVSDRGSGIPDSEKKKVFNRFYTNREQGYKLHSGLGLSIVKKILEENGASIECLDNIPIGSIFRMKL